jgi:hypothetical protein
MIKEQFAFLLDLCKLVAYAAERGFSITMGEAFRTPEQQAIYVQTGRSKTLNSYHLKRLAQDLNFFLDGTLCYDREKLQPLGDYWESLDPKNSWGGNWGSFKDLPHFERRAG